MPFWNIGSIRVSFPLENIRIKKEEWTGLLAKPKFESSAPTQNNFKKNMMMRTWRMWSVMPETIKIKQEVPNKLY